MPVPREEGRGWNSMHQSHYNVASYRFLSCLLKGISYEVMHKHGSG